MTLCRTSHYDRDGIWIHKRRVRLCGWELSLSLSLLLRVSVVAFLIALASGCGGKPTDGRLALNGTVTLDHEPLSTGNITFFTDGAAGAGAEATGGTIQDGKFTIAKEQGLPAGAYQVAITAATIVGPVAADPNERMEHPPEVRSLIPAKYNSSTTLTAQVKESSKNDFTFDLTSK